MYDLLFWDGFDSKKIIIIFFLVISGFFLGDGEIKKKYYFKNMI